MTQFDFNSDDREILAFLHSVADAAADTLDEIADWSLSGEADGQYSADVVVDDVVVAMLEVAGFGVLSEESGATDVTWPIQGDGLLVVVDPLDGSTNASKGLPWFATSLCVVDRDGLRVALVADQSGSERRFSAIRGAGALCDGSRIHVQPVELRATAVVGTNGVPAMPHEWWQVRTMGAAALDISLVASGALDGYVDFHGHGVWDYLAAVLICREAGALVEEAHGRDLFTLDTAERRQPLVASSPEILASLREAVAKRNRQL